MVLVFGIGFAVLFFGFQFGVEPVLEKRDDLKRILENKTEGVQEMARLRHEYLKVSGNVDAKTRGLSVRKKGFSLFAFLDAQARASNVKAHVAYMKPFSKKIDKSDTTLATVKVKLTQVYLKDLMDFLYRIESSRNSVDITSLSLTKSGKEKNTIDAVIETQTLMLKEKA